MKAATERLDVASEELAALVEEVREAQGETGYQKLQAAIRTLGYATELLEARQATLEKLRRLLCHSGTEVKKGTEAGRHRDWREAEQGTGRPEE
jgi:hypothetical protein